MSSNGIIDGSDNLVPGGSISFGAGDGAAHAVLGIPAEIPEPTSLVLALLGAASMFLLPRRRR